MSLDFLCVDCSAHTIGLVQAAPFAEAIVSTLSWHVSTGQPRRGPSDSTVATKRTTAQGPACQAPQQKVLQIWVTYCLGPEPEVQTWEGDPNLEDLRAHCVSLVF